jgi:transposase, IS30 family
LISQWKAIGLANKECARRLSRDIKTIRRELKRNNVKVKVGKYREIIYEPLHAQALAEGRKQYAYQAKQPLKNKKVYEYVLRHLRQGWSPEQISGRLKEVDHPGDSSWQICHETIYQFIYKSKTDLSKIGLEQQRVLDGRKRESRGVITVTDHQRPLWEYLRRKQVRRRKLSGRKVHRIMIPDRVSIHDRPDVINQRQEFGHWEGDSVVGKNHASGLHSEYERVSSLTRFEKLERITTREAMQAAQTIFEGLPSSARRSTTLDNGLEHVDHVILKVNLKMQTYFADPYSSWQRGGNENANLWIRYYFPKGTDFSKISNQELKEVEWELNNRPRKRLNFKTPQEVFNYHLSLI